MKSVKLPPEGEGLTVVASVSGGKDSTALILALREAEIPARYVFADTGWEADETYEYLDMLRSRLDISIDVVGTPGGMVERVRHRAGFPAGMRRWCTKELKIDPLRKYHDALGVETVSAVGVRAQESRARAQLAEWTDDDEWGGYVWRPLIAWPVEDVLLIHRRHGVPVNPLYQRGHNRVGCYPCIYEDKEGIRLIAEHDPQRIDVIDKLETWCTEERARRNEEKPGRYSWPVASFFQMRDRVNPSGNAESTIHRVVDWARTDYGGRQMSMLAPPPRGGCMRWGLCETAPANDIEPIADDGKETA